MKYEKLSKEAQEQMLEQRLIQYEQEHFAHATNKALLQATGDTDPSVTAAIAEADKAMAVLDKAHANTKVEIAKLKK